MNFVKFSKVLNNKIEIIWQSLVRLSLWHTLDLFRAAVVHAIAVEDSQLLNYFL